MARAQLLHPIFFAHVCRLLVESMVMTGSDLCASAKPWHLQLETVSVIYEEFYIQVAGEGQPFSPTDSG
jgi:hypothetical protein